MAAFMTWKEAYNVNITEIDQQHKKLVDLINKLAEAMSHGKGKEVLGEVFGQLISYCSSHFATEERLFDQYSYPEAAEHKDKHRKVTAKVLALQQEMREGKKTISMEVMDFLEQWLDKHILGTDMKYSAYLTGKGVK